MTPLRGDLVICTQKYRNSVNPHFSGNPDDWSPKDWGIVVDVHNRDPRVNYYTYERFTVFTCRGRYLRYIEAKHFRHIDT